MKKIPALCLSMALILSTAGCVSGAADSENMEAESAAAGETSSDTIDAEELRPNENPFDTSQTGGWLLTEEEISKAKAEAGNDLESRPDENVCYISIDCVTAIDAGLNEEEGFTYLPSDGVIFPETEVAFEEGDTAFDVLVAVVRAEGIHMEYSGGAGLEYIEGIDNLYEFDAGDRSGWMFAVNGWYPSYGCGQYKIEPGDVIRWSYTCDLGEDLGSGMENGT
ncbi:MAG TPA: DUF4430 domain-containing protein [Oscillospiraceae bacterium]|nr:DUF4430 domain-containing protein [Oscillospiraceae bacterium]